MAAVGCAVDRVVTLDPSSVPANSVQVESFSVVGLRKGWPVQVNKHVRDAGLVIIETQCPDADVLEITFQNFTGSAINPDSQSFRVTQV